MTQVPQHVVSQAMKAAGDNSFHKTFEEFREWFQSNADRDQYQDGYVGRMGRITLGVEKKSFIG